MMDQPTGRFMVAGRRPLKVWPVKDGGVADPGIHWADIWTTRDAETVAWFQDLPAVSLTLVTEIEPRRDAAVIDVGGGASTLVDHLLDEGYTDITVLDIADAALDQTRARLGDRSGRVHFVAADITMEPLERRYDVWHDRAAFHFLTDPVDRAAYVGQAERSVATGGHLVIAAFALDGPEQCSGLPVQRWSPELLADEFARAFSLVTKADDLHDTPTGGQQHFVYAVLRRR
jgi:SAM-dependent methyltransferase